MAKTQKSHILLRTDNKEQRRLFKKACNKQGVTMTMAMNVLMREVINGDILLEQRFKIRKDKQNGKNKMKTSNVYAEIKT